MPSDLMATEDSRTVFQDLKKFNTGTEASKRLHDHDSKDNYPITQQSAKITPPAVVVQLEKDDLSRKLNICKEEQDKDELFETTFIS